MNSAVLSLDQGTTSTRAVLVDHSGKIIASAQREHRQIFPQPGWVEHDATEILSNTYRVIADVISTAQIDARQLAGIGITNQRETVIVWDRVTGDPIHNAIVWQDTRTKLPINALIAQHGVDHYRKLTGLPLSTYFSASKLAWLLEHVPGARERAERGELMFGTPDSWILWNLSGGPDGGVHLTDVTNASRTQLMNLETLNWDETLLNDFDIPLAMLPDIASSSEIYATAHSPKEIRGVRLAGILGDQQAATFGQAIFHPGVVKNTYGTGNFLLTNTGAEIRHSQHGLISTVAYQLGDSPAQYALEGSVAVTGSLVQWLRDNLGIIESSSEIEKLAASVADNGGVYIVPAFSGLYAPYWRPDARGVICGLTRFATKAHIARAALEATAYQTADLVAAINNDLDTPLTELRVDGGMVVNDLLMQFQADVLGVDVLRPHNIETTALGAAFAAGLAVGFWSSLTELEGLWAEDHRWASTLAPDDRNSLIAQWKQAIERSLNWET